MNEIHVLPSYLEIPITKEFRDLLIFEEFIFNQMGKISADKILANVENKMMNIARESNIV